MTTMTVRDLYEQMVGFATSDMSLNEFTVADFTKFFTNVSKFEI